MASETWSNHKTSIIGTAMSMIPKIAPLLADGPNQAYAVKNDYFRAIQQMQRALTVLKAQDTTVDWTATQQQLTT